MVFFCGEGKGSFIPNIYSVTSSVMDIGLPNEQRDQLHRPCLPSPFQWPGLWAEVIVAACHVKYLGQLV